MKNQKLCGIMPALLTPFSENGVDTKKAASFVSYLADCGVHGLYVGGSSGEMLLMTQNERKELLETVVGTVGDRITVIAHIGSTSTAAALELARHAEKTGAHALSSVTPFYFKYSFRELKNYYERVADATSLPVIIYNIPALTGAALSTAQLKELLSIPNVGGMKFTASDFFQFERLHTAFPDKIFYNGSDEMLCSGLAAGADGGIGSTYNVMPKRILAIYNAFRANDVSLAMKYQSEANAVIEEVLRWGVMPSCKALLKLNGRDYGVCREPFLPLSDEALEALAKVRVE